MASRSLNRVMLIGNLTRDPELKYTPNGTAVCSFGLATNRSWATTTGEFKEDVQFHRIVSWQKLAELCGKLLSKGRKIYLEGRIVYRTFVGRDGVQRSITEIVMDDFILFDDRNRNISTASNTPAIQTVEEPNLSTDSSDFNIVEETKTADSTQSSDQSMIKTGRKKKEASKPEKKIDEETVIDDKINEDDIPF